jgi:hypothetical protein
VTPRPVEVKWIDSVILDSGQWGDDFAFQAELTIEGMTMVSIGWLIDENECGILLALTWDEKAARLQGALIIPRVAVRNISYLDGDAPPAKLSAAS